MATFNIFDKSTWAPEVPKDINQIITNRALGAIGQKIGELRTLEDNLKKHHVAPVDNVEYTFAKELLDHSPEIAKIMEVRVHYPDDAIAHALNDIAFIMERWSDVSRRRSSWQELIPVFTRLKPFLDTDVYTPPLETRLQIKVSGNAAWDLYLRKSKHLQVAEDNLNLYRKERHEIAKRLKEEDDSEPDSDRYDD
jgi:hypothetical protein